MISANFIITMFESRENVPKAYTNRVSLVKDNKLIRNYCDYQIQLLVEVQHFHLACCCNVFPSINKIPKDRSSSRKKIQLQYSLMWFLKL